MSKSKRQIELLLTLNTKKKFTTKQLAEEFGVSKRTILRDLQELSEAGLPLYSEMGVNGGYQVLKEKVLPPISFTIDEATAMFFAYQSLQYYSSLPFESEAISALKKFYQHLPSNVKQRINLIQDRITFWAPTHELELPFLKEVLHHAVEQDVLIITYRSEKSTKVRDIQPVGVYASNGHWYCPAYCFEAKQIRNFRIDRILNLSISSEQMKKINLSKLTIQEYLETDEPAQTIPLVVHLNRKAVMRCQSDYWFSKRLIIHADGTGMIQANISPDFMTWLANFFISCGTDAHVEEPEELVEMMKVSIQSLARQYDI